MTYKSFILTLIIILNFMLLLKYLKGKIEKSFFNIDYQNKLKRKINKKEVTSTLNIESKWMYDMRCDINYYKRVEAYVISKINLGVISSVT